MDISNDSLAILLICSDLSLRNTDNMVKPLSALQWSKLSECLEGNGLTPGSLFDISCESIRNKLCLVDTEIDRIDRLLSRAGQVSMELTALNNKGIFVLTIADDMYPSRLIEKLKKHAPPLLYYAGDLQLLKKKGISIVGSRNIDEAALRFTEQLSKRCANDGLNVVSGGARGVDSIAENTANMMGGTSIIVLADDMDRKIRNKEIREAILEKRSLILSPFRPDMPFQTYAAMERNKYIYALSDFAVVVSSDYNKGGTWAGANENIRGNWTPLFVRKSDNMPQGNAKLLMEDDVKAISEEAIFSNTSIYDWFKEKSSMNGIESNAQQLSLFSL